MNRIVPLAAGAIGAMGAAAGALVIRERRMRRASERLAAALLETLLNTIDATDADTGAHVRRVAQSAMILAEAAELDESQQRSVERIALFHDIGKIHEAIFDIVRDKESLTPAQWKAIATHPKRGAEVLASLDMFYPDLAIGVLTHHERWDGTGYPNKLRGPEIPLAARIVSIADSFDAITHRRRYRDARSTQDAVAAIAQGRGTQFDPDLTDLFLSPPVLGLVQERASDTREPRKKPDRRVGHFEQAPDVTFRWRTVRRAPHKNRAQRTPT